ncbi:MAG: hypothetical protein HP490_04905 [Nitrospira sp.]|nr:hypothetical protein [Nitrospira sp.]
MAPNEITEYLIKKGGDAVQKDDILAENKPLFKWLKTEIRSPITGTVESISTVTGQVLLREPPRVLELLGYVDGAVVEIHPQQGVTIECLCSMVQGIFGIGGETYGELVMAVAAPDEALTPVHVKPDMKGKIVVGGSFLPADTMVKAKEVGVAGLVVGGIHDKDLRALLLGRCYHRSRTGWIHVDPHRGVRHDPDGPEDLCAALCPCRCQGVDLRRHADQSRCHSP